MIHYQVTLPINTTYMRKSRGTSRIMWDRESTAFYLPSRREAMALPERLLTELSRIWLATLEFLSGTVTMTPVPRSSSRSVRHFAYNNCVPSFAIRPVLLAGHRVQSLLAATIRPRSRTLKFCVSIPRMIPGICHHAFLLTFNSTVQLPSRKHAGGGLLLRSRFKLVGLPHVVPSKKFELCIPWWLENRD